MEMTVNNTLPPTTKPAMNALTFFPFVPAVEVGEGEIVGVAENGIELVVFVEVVGASVEAEPLRTIK